MKQTILNITKQILLILIQKLTLKMIQTLKIMINKQNKLKIYYRYQDYADVDEVSGHVLGLGYAFEF